MRNLKRALSLALASVMLLGMMVVGTSAASYTDVDDNDNVEAIEVLNAVQVMIGRQGNFEPDEAVNRHEMAVIMAKLYLGSEEADNYVGSHPFTDVVSWADKYVAACYENNLISGTSATTYSGSQPLTAAQAALMMLRALGYEHLTKNATDWRAPVTAQANKIGLFKGVVSSPNAQLTRNNVAQLALNALESDVVDFTGELGWEVNGVSVGFQAKWEPRRDLNNVSNYGYNYTNDSGTTHQKEYLQLLEDLYDGKLTKDTRDYDDFDRPATTWKYNGKVIGSYMNTPNLTYTAEVKLGDIYKDLGLGKAVAASKVDFSRNGLYENATDAMTKANDGTTALSTLGLTKGDDTNKIGKNGVLTQVWYHSDDETVDITMIDTYVGKINSVTKASGNTARSVTVSDFGSPANTLGSDLNKKFETEDFAAKDIVLYTAAWNGTKYDIKTMEALGAPDTGTLTKWNGSTYSDSTGKSENNFTSNGTTYKYSANKVIVNDAGTQTGPSGIAAFKVNETDINVYTDKYGYAIYVSGVEGAKNYAAVIGVGTTNPYGDSAGGCTLLLPDGTMKAVNYKMKSGSADLTEDNYVHSNTTPSDDGYSADIVRYRVLDTGTYELEVVNNVVNSVDDYTTANHEDGFDTADDIKFVNGKSAFVLSGHSTGALNRTLYTTSNTIFMVCTKDSSNADKRVYNVYTGYNNAPSIDTEKVNKSVAYVTNSYYTSQIDVVYLGYESMAGITSVDAYIAKKAGADIITDSTGSYYELAAVVNGEVTTLKVDASIVSLTPNASTKGVWAISNVVRDKNDIITGFSDVSATTFANGANWNINGKVGTVSANGVVLGVGASNTTEAASETALISAATYWAYTSGTKVYAVSDDYKTIEAIDITSVDTDLNDKVYASLTDGNAGSEKKLKDVFVVEVKDTASSGGDSGLDPEDSYVTGNIADGFNVTTETTPTNYEVAQLLQAYLAGTAGLEKVTYDGSNATITFVDGSTQTAAVNVVSGTGAATAAKVMDEIQSAIESATSAADRPDSRANITVEGNTMKVTTAAGSGFSDGDDRTYFTEGTDSTGADNGSMHDLARFLGKLRTDAGAAEIEYADKTYTWEDDATVNTISGSSKSKWFHNTGSTAVATDTLVGAIVAANKSSIASWVSSGHDSDGLTLNIALTVDGAPMNIEITIPQDAP